MSMQYVQSYKDYFQHPKWIMNTLLGGVCTMIPLVGQIVLNGWLITQRWAMGDEQDPAKLPAFEFNHFEKYLKRGLWPFLVQLVAGLALGIILGVVITVIIFLMLAVVATAGDAAAVAFPILFLLFMVVGTALVALIQALLAPLVLKATLTQNFSEAFDFGFSIGFLKLVWKELIMSSLFLLVTFFGLMIVTFPIAVITFGLGSYLAVPPVFYAWQHLMKQLYRLHLERGGQEVALSETLNDTPPSLPEPAQGPEA